MRRTFVRAVVVAFVVGVAFANAGPAGAFHLFPVVPGDPGGDCGATLDADPGDSATNVTLEGFFFIDESNGTSTTEITAGESVSWHWIKFCHSVTATSVPKGAQSFTTRGGPPINPNGFPPDDQDELVKPEGDNNSYTVTFTVPGTYEYQCVHHASVGMTGTVVVEEAEAPSDEGENGGDEGGGGGGAGGGPEVLGAVSALPATGGSVVVPGLGLAALALFGRRLLMR